MAFQQKITYHQEMKFKRVINLFKTSFTVFAFIIMLLIILVYVLFEKVSILEEKQKNLIQEIGILKEKNNLDG